MATTSNSEIVSRRRKRLKDWIDRHHEGLQAGFVERTGINQGELSGLLKSKSFGEKKARSLEKLAGMPAYWLDSDEPAGANVSPTQIGTRRIPLISYVQAGHMTEAVDSYPVGAGAEWILTDLELSPTAFALKIKGDSMLPEFREGDTVIIDPAVQPLPGDFVVAKNGDHEATFKKYRPRGHNDRGDTVFELVPLNEDYASTRSDITPVRIIGTMVEHRRYRKR
jgi:SOS-response transcriptional repressor LexA